MQNPGIDHLIVSVGSHRHNRLHFLSQHLSRVGRRGRGMPSCPDFPQSTSPGLAAGHAPPARRHWGRLQAGPRPALPRAHACPACLSGRTCPTHASPVPLKVSLRCGWARELRGAGRGGTVSSACLCLIALPHLASRGVFLGSHTLPRAPRSHRASLLFSRPLGNSLWVFPASRYRENL